MKSGSIKIIVLLFVVAFLSSSIGYVSGVRASQKDDTPKTIDTNPPFPVIDDTSQEEPLPIPELPDDKGFTQKYVLREYNGNIALFTCYSNGEEALHDVYDVSVSLLPESDRKLLKEGIECDSLSNALQLAEDYSS